MTWDDGIPGSRPTSWAMRSSLWRRIARALPYMLRTSKSLALRSSARFRMGWSGCSEPESAEDAAGGASTRRMGSGNSSALIVLDRGTAASSSLTELCLTLTLESGKSTLK